MTGLHIRQSDPTKRQNTNQIYFDVILEWYGLLGQMSTLQRSVLQRTFTHEPDARQVQIFWFKPPALLLHGSARHGDIDVTVVLKGGIE